MRTNKYPSEKKLMCVRENRQLHVSAFNSAITNLYKILGEGVRDNDANNINQRRDNKIIIFVIQCS